jgi:dTDP-D-glucose 4,6-dehydratase
MATLVAGGTGFVASNIMREAFGKWPGSLEYQLSKNTFEWESKKRQRQPAGKRFGVAVNSG